MGRTLIGMYFCRGIESQEFCVIEKLPCEEILYQGLLYVQKKICLHSNTVENLSSYLPAFGLRDLDNNNITYPPSHIFHADGKRKKCKLCVRFRPPCVNYMQNNIVWEYFLLQCLDDFLLFDLGKFPVEPRFPDDPEINKDVLMKLSRIAILIPERLPLDDAEVIGLSHVKTFKFRNYYKRFSPELFRRLNSAQNRFTRLVDYFLYYLDLKNWLNYQVDQKRTIGFFKKVFLYQLIKMFPWYGFDSFKAKSVGEHEDITFFIKVYQSQEEIFSKVPSGVYFGQERQCHLKDIKGVRLIKPTSTVSESTSESRKWKVNIRLDIRARGAENSEMYVAFDEEEDLKCAMGMLQGYMILCIDPDCYISDFTPPSIDIKKRLQSFGPWSSTKAKGYLWSSNNLKTQQKDFLLYQDISDYKRFNIAHRTSEDDSSTWLEWNLQEWTEGKLSFQLKNESELLKEFKDVRDIREVRSELNKKFGSQLSWTKEDQGVDPDSIFATEPHEYDLVSSSNPASTSETGTESDVYAFTIEDFSDLEPISDRTESDNLMRTRATLRDKQYMLLELTSSKGNYHQYLLKAIKAHVTLARLHRDSVMRYYGHVLSKNLCWRFDFTEYGTLTDFVHTNKGTLKTYQKMSLASGVVKVVRLLEVQHHGNIRGRNFFVFLNDGRTPSVKLGDPGLVYYYDTHPNDCLDINDERTPWLAPERRNNLKAWTIMTEIFSIGTTICEILNSGDDFRSFLNCPGNRMLSDYFCGDGKELGQKLTPPELQPDLNDPNCPHPEVCKVIERLWAVVIKCWAKDPAERPDANGLVDSVESIVEDTMEKITCERMTEDLIKFLPSSNQSTKDASPSTIQDLITTKNPWYLHPGNLVVDRNKLLGKGHYGNVYLGKMKPKKRELATVYNDDSWIDVAIKEPFEINRIVTQDLLKEIQLMAELDHPHIVRFMHFSCNVENMQPQLIMEYMKLDSLEKHVLKNQSKFENKDTSEGFKRDLTRYCLQTAKGIVYLHGRRIVHCDLAPRNILLTKVGGQLQPVAKVSDFGLSKVFKYNKAYYINKNVRSLPISDYPPEIMSKLLDGDNNEIIHTQSGDTWLFGIMMWKVFNPGQTSRAILNQENHVKKPTDLADMLKLYHSGKRLPKTKNISDTLYQIMQKCWEYDEQKRPTFVDIEQDLEKEKNPH